VCVYSCTTVGNIPKDVLMSGTGAFELERDGVGSKEGEEKESKTECIYIHIYI